MAKQRIINTRFWSDGWVRKLNPLDRYLFIYFLTNEHTNICGIYELPIENLSFESGIDKNDLENAMLPKLQPKVIYKDGWVIMPNFLKYQNQGSPKVQRGIEYELNNIPSHILDIAIKYGYPMDTLSHLNTNTNTNTNTNLTEVDTPKKEENHVKTPKEEAEEFFKSQDMQNSMIKMLSEKGIPDGVAKRELGKFVLYWTESTPSGKKQRWNLEKTFEIRRRLATWFRNFDKFSNRNGSRTRGIVSSV